MDSLDRVFSRLADQYALAECKSVGLDYDGDITGLNVFKSFTHVGESLICCRWDPVFLHEVLAEGLGSFDDGSLAVRSEGLYPCLVKKVHSSHYKRIVGSHHAEIYFVLYCKISDLLYILGTDIHQSGVLCHSAVSWSGKYLSCLRALLKCFYDGVFSSASAYN